MDNISFTSKLIPTKTSDFNKFTSSLNRNCFVDYPWTLSTSRISKDVFTHRICDCTSCLITDGDKALLMHLIPSNERNHHFNSVLEYLRNNIDLKNKHLQAVLLGSKNTKPSQDLWNKFINLLDYLKIPTTILKEGKSPTHIAYRTCTDEVLISNEHIDKLLKKGINNRDALVNGFKNVYISPFDEV